MVVKFYYDLMSQPCRALYIFLKQTKIPFEPKQIALRKLEHHSEEFTAINPLKKVPVMTHNDFVLTESVAMVRYLSREFPTEDHWYPKESRARAKIDEFLEWQHLNVRLHGSLIFMHKYLFPIMRQKPVNHVKIDHYRGELDTVLDNMENMFLSKTKFINQNEISVADIFAACEIEQPITAGYDVLKEKPKLKEWMERVKAKCQPDYEAAHKYNEVLRIKLTAGDSNL